MFFLAVKPTFLFHREAEAASGATATNHDGQHGQGVNDGCDGNGCDGTVDGDL